MHNAAQDWVQGESGTSQRQLPSPQLLDKFERASRDRDSLVLWLRAVAAHVLLHANPELQDWVSHAWKEPGDHP